MKELSIEEKAKAYDEAKARMSKAYNDNRCTISFMNEIFPELAKSKDEKIRKAMIKYFTNGKEYLSLTPYSREDYIAWLEKYGEQNPADKVEPKFKVGDWVTDGISKCQIRFIDDTQYWYSENCILGSIEFVNKRYHLWTIQDAKDGNVLCTYECCNPKIVFILKGTPKKHYALSYHCYYNIMYPHFGSDSEKGCLAPNDEDVKPATKEQRDLLFQKMKEAGYDWDAEKKELKKIEQKPAWSEDDDENFKWFEKFFRAESVLSDGRDIPQERYLWFKSLKDRHTWKPSDEQMMALNYVVNLMASSERPTENDLYYNILKSLREQLKKLREE